MYIQKKITKKRAVEIINKVREEVKELKNTLGEYGLTEGEPLAVNSKEDPTVWWLYDGYTDSIATLWDETECLTLKTALSGFWYVIRKAEDGCWYQSYEGAWNGLQAQEIAPKALMTMDWQDCLIWSTLNEKWNGLTNQKVSDPLTWGEYEALRAARV